MMRLFYKGLPYASACLLIALFSSFIQTPSSYKSFFQDKKYANGFTLGHVVDGTPGTLKLLNYEGKVVTDPVWKIAQWNNYNNNLEKATYTQTKNTHSYFTPAGTGIVANTKKGSITLTLNTTTEYGHSKACPNNPRKSGDKWPHLLLEYGGSPAIPIANKTNIHMFINYTMTQMDNETPEGLYDPTLHTAQFQWFITIQNLNKKSSGYGEYFWFGLSLYDDRNEFSPEYASQDTNTTSSFIYMPDMKEIMGKQGKTEVGKNISLNIDIYPYLKNGFETAKKNNYMKNSTWEDLEISSSNIGWEVPGTYNVSVTIKKIDLTYK